MTEMRADKEEGGHLPVGAVFEGRELDQGDPSHRIAVQSSKKRRRKKCFILFVVIVIVLLVAVVTIPLVLLLKDESNTGNKPNSTSLMAANTATPLPGWGSWTSCSVTCGNGTKYRSRVCATQSTNCNVELIPCIMTSCGKNASWGQWSRWSPCSVTCANGKQFRNRTCTESDASRCKGQGQDQRNCTRPPCPKKDCLDLLLSGDTSDGVYTVDPDQQGPFQVYCNMTTDGGGWTVFQRRQDGSEDFFRTWDEYKTGFGNLSGEFWLGNDKIHRLTSMTLTRLSVDLQSWSGGLKNATYGKFQVENETLNYTLTVESYSGNAGDSFTQHNGMKFTTKDRDNDIEGASNCAVGYRGGWWFKACLPSNLNGKYVGNTANRQGIVWLAISTNTFNSLKFTQMRFRRQW